MRLYTGKEGNYGILVYTELTWRERLSVIYGLLFKNSCLITYDPPSMKHIVDHFQELLK